VNEQLFFHPNLHIVGGFCSPFGFHLLTYRFCCIEWSGSTGNKSSHVFTVCAALLRSAAYAVWTSKYCARARFVECLVLLSVELMLVVVIMVLKMQKMG